MQDFMTHTVGQQLERVAAAFPHKEAIQYTDRPYRRTWQEFNDECDRIAKGFLAHGVKKGDKIAIWATNVPEWLLTLFAACKIGAVLVTVNTAYKVFELEYLLKQSDTKLLVMIDGYKGTSYVEIVRELCKGLGKRWEHLNPMLPFLDEVVYAGAGDCPAGMTPWAQLEKDGEQIPDEALREIGESLSCHDVINMQYTSGTTGFPKGVMLSHYNILNNGKGIGDCMRFTENDKLCVVVPFFHCFGLVLATMASLTHATTMVPVDLYSPVKVMEAISRERCTAFHGVPTMYIAMLEHPDFEKYDFSSLRTGIMAGSPCPVKVMQAVVERMNMREITITYGQTEASPATTMTTTDDSLELRVNTVGRAMPYVETKIVDPDTGRTLGPGEVGEFCSRGYNTMQGYYKMEEATRQVIDKDGWLHSGDLATVDENGYYKITGRIKDMIIRGGENIYPKEIEEFLYTIPDIQDVQVIGVPSQRFGEEVMACIVRREGSAITEEEVKELVRSHMARHKVPRYVAFLDAFPMTASGKIQKFRLREWAVEELRLDDTAETA
ncbi:MAG: AMP-binding protein [Angelakisella sp.]|jgi:fatty-acyl-CoA synthase|nr:AMP-binding protein [Angelakisella sp.]MCI9529432.1 AMP-binding protein [Angelakisella sp.]